MIRHIVMFKAREMTPEEKVAAIRRLKEAIDRMEDAVPEVQYLQTGVNINPRPQAFDLVLVSDFHDEAALDVYRSHPLHQEVMDVIREVVDKVHVVDFVM